MSTILDLMTTMFLGYFVVLIVISDRNFDSPAAIAISLTWILSNLWVIARLWVRL